MIGSVRIRFGDGMVDVTLDDDLLWKAQDSVLQTHLNTVFNARDGKWRSPAMGEPYWALLGQVAALFDGYVTKYPDQKRKKGVVY